MCTWVQEASMFSEYWLICFGLSVHILSWELFTCLRVVRLDFVQRTVPSGANHGLRHEAQFENISLLLSLSTTISWNISNVVKESIFFWNASLGGWQQPFCSSSIPGGSLTTLFFLLVCENSGVTFFFFFSFCCLGSGLHYPHPGLHQSDLGEKCFHLHSSTYEGPLPTFLNVEALCTTFLTCCPCLLFFFLEVLGIPTVSTSKWFLQGCVFLKAPIGCFCI